MATVLPSAAPVPSGPSIAIGTIAGDDVVNAAEHAAALVVSGTTSGVEDGRTLTLGLSGAQYQVSVAGGVWSVTIPASAVGALTDAGSLYRVSADVSNASGTPAPQASRSLAVDTSADTAEAAALSVGITPDRIVNEPESAFVPYRVTGLDADANALATFTDGVHTVQAVVSANGAYRVDLSGFDGPVTASLAIEDAAGNHAAVSGNTITIDQKAPVTYDTDGPGAPRISLVHDTGASGSDHATSDAQIAIASSGTELALVTDVDGQVVSHYDPAALADGNHVVTVTAIDQTGRAVSAGTLSFGLDRTAPQVAVTGTSGLGRVVDHVLSGSVSAEDAGATITIRDGGSVIGTATADDHGAWSLPFAFDGAGGHDYAFTASATDAAGNTGASDAFYFSVDFGANRALFETVVHDAQGAAAQVYALYEAILDRAPDMLGWEGWVPAVEHGLSANALAAQLLASPEYAAHHGTQESGATFVAHLYENALGRSGSPAEIAHWTDALAAGTARADVATAITFSGEGSLGLAPTLASGIALPDAEAAAVARLYYGLLDRAPDAAGLTQATVALHGGQSITSLAQTLLGSSEYAVLHPGTVSDADFVGALYADALGRGGSAGEIAQWTDALSHGASRAAVAVAISESGEAMLHLAARIEMGWHLHS